MLVFFEKVPSRPTYSVSSHIVVKCLTKSDVMFRRRVSPLSLHHIVEVIHGPGDELSAIRKVCTHGDEACLKVCSRVVRWFDVFIVHRQITAQVLVTFRAGAPVSQGGITDNKIDGSV